MTDYCDITLGRYLRCIIRTYVTYQEMGFRKETLDEFLELATKEAIYKSKEFSS